MSERLYRIRHLANGDYELSVKSGVDGRGEDIWVPAARQLFDTLEAAEAGVHRLVNEAIWFYDDKGRPA